MLAPQEELQLSALSFMDQPNDNPRQSIVQVFVIANKSD